MWRVEYIVGRFDSCSCLLCGFGVLLEGAFLQRLLGAVGNYSRRAACELWAR